MKKIIAGVSALALSLSMTSVAFAATANTQQSISATVQENLTLSCAAVDIDGGTTNLVADGSTIVSNTTYCLVTTNDTDGYHLQIREDTPLTHTDGDTIADKTAWNGSNATAYSPTGLAFRVSNNDTGAMNTTAWGTNTTCTANDTNELFAGLPNTLTDILEEDDYNAGSSNTTICYAVSVPSTQKSGEYTGQVTYSVTTGA